MNTEQERAAFEAWAQNSFELHRHSAGEYSSNFTQTAWAAWQAGRNRPAPAPTRYDHPTQKRYEDWMDQHFPVPSLRDAFYAGAAAAMAEPVSADTLDRLYTGRATPDDQMLAWQALRAMSGAQEPVAWPTHEFAIVVDRMYEGEGPSLAMWNGENYNFTDGDCCDRDPDGSLDGYTAEWLTHHQLEQRLFPQQPAEPAREPGNDDRAAQGLPPYSPRRPTEEEWNRLTENGRKAWGKKPSETVKVPSEISRQLLGNVVDEVFDGAIEDVSVIEDIYRVIVREYGHPARYGHPAEPEGWQLVPKEPTEEMLAATSWPNCAGTDYKHMLSSAPKFGEEEE